MKASADHAIMILPSIDKGKYAFRQQNISSAKDSVRTILWAEVRRVFREQMGRFAKADEAAGLTPGNEDNAGSRFICREKPCLLLSIDGNDYATILLRIWQDIQQNRRNFVCRPLSLKRLFSAYIDIKPPMR